MSRPGSVYQFGYPAFLALPELTTKTNSFDDFNKKIGIFYSIDCGCYLFIHSLLIWTSTNLIRNRLNQLRMEL